jgi:hypothetical protein
MRASLPNKTLKQLYEDIAIRPGSAVGHSRVKAESKSDPFIKLSKPLNNYINDNFIFFYCGLLYGFCRLDASITERFREQANSSIKTRMHMFDKALFTVSGFEKFTDTRVSKLLQSVESGVDQQNLFDFISSQLIIDKQRKKVWKVKTTTCKIPDPYLIDNKEIPVAVEVVVFCPYQYNVSFEPISKSEMFVGTPEIQSFSRNDPEFEIATRKALK